MAQTEEEKLQANLFKELEKSNVKVSDSDAEQMKENIKKADSGAQWLGLGVHEVFIKAIELTQAKTGTLGMKFIVENDEGKNEVVFWLSEKALPYSIENISRLIVHNTPEDKKNLAREYVADNIITAKEIFSLAKERLIEGAAFLSVRESKTDTYTDSKGEEKPSLDRSLLSYRPKADAQQAAAAIVGGGKSVDSETKADLPF